MGRPDNATQIEISTKSKLFKESSSCHGALISSEIMEENETKVFSLEDSKVTTEEIFSNSSKARVSQPGLGQLLTESSWSYGGANFWIMFMFGGLVISYIVHLVHVMKLVQLRQQGLDDDFEGKTYTRASAMLSMRGLERQNTTFLHVRPEDEIEDQSKHIWENYYILIPRLLSKKEDRLKDEIGNH